MKLGELPAKPPQVDVAPEAESYEAAEEAVEIAELAGLALDDWQEYCLYRSMGMDDGLWAAFEVGLVVGRQNGKSEVLIARILSDLFTQLSSPKLTIFAAHEYKTAREIFLRLRPLLDPPPDSDPLLHADPLLLEQVKTVRTANGEESIELHNGRRVRFVARTSGSGRGFTGDTVLLDEAYKLTNEQVSALLYTMGARPNPQLWYASMGPFEDSEKQLQLMERARSDPERMAYLGWEAPEGTDPANREWWVKTQPAHPHRMSMQTLEDEFQADPDGFAREKLCMVVAPVSAVISHYVWEQNQNPQAVPVDGLMLGVDVNVEGTQRAIVVADREGRIEVVDYAPVAGIAERLIQLHEDHNAPVALDMKSQAATYVPELEAADVDLVKYAAPDMATAAARFNDLAQSSKLEVRTHDALNAAVKGAVKRPLGDGAWAWGRRKSTVDISPLVAATLAVDAAVKPKHEDQGLVVYSLDDY